MSLNARSARWDLQDGPPFSPLIIGEVAQHNKQRFFNALTPSVPSSSGKPLNIMLCKVEVDFGAFSPLVIGEVAQQV